LRRADHAPYSAVHTSLFLWITLLAPVGIVASWAGPVEDKALRDAAVSTDSKFQTQHECAIRIRYLPNRVVNPNRSCAAVRLALIGQALAIVFRGLMATRAVPRPFARTDRIRIHNIRIFGAPAHTPRGSLLPALRPAAFARLAPRPESSRILFVRAFSGTSHWPAN